MGRLDEVIIKMTSLFEEYNTDGDKYLNSEETKALLEKEVNINNFQENLTMDNVKDSLKQLNSNQETELRLLDFGRALTQLAIVYHRNKKRGNK